VLVTISESSIKNYLAERIVQNPQSIVEMRPSQLLQQRAQQQPQPRIENENQAAPAANSNRSASSNANTAVTNANKR
jgi:hypothetical protein